MLEVRDCRNSGLWIQMNFYPNADGPADIIIDRVYPEGKQGQRNRMLP